MAAFAEEFKAGIEKGEEFDVEAVIKEFLADDSRRTLELPHMTSGQRKQVKKLAEQHSGLRCESYGFGQERQLHLFKPVQEASPEALPGIQEQASVSAAEASAIILSPKGASPPRAGAEQQWETATTEACSTAASTLGSPTTSPRNSVLLRHRGIGKPPGLTVRNTFIDFETDKSDDRQVQSMPHGMFGQCLWAEVLSESVAERALLSPSAEKEKPQFTAPLEQLELPASRPPTLEEHEIGSAAEHQLATGVEVEITGLSKAPQFNGRRATVQSFDMETGRYNVSMWSAAGEQKAKIKRENLIPVPPLSPAAAPFVPSGSYHELWASTMTPRSQDYPWALPVQSPTGQYLQAR